MEFHLINYICNCITHYVPIKITLLSHADAFLFRFVAYRPPLVGVIISGRDEYRLPASAVLLCALVFIFFVVAGAHLYVRWKLKKERVTPVENVTEAESSRASPKPEVSDPEFMNAVLGVLTENLGNENFGINELASAMSISYSSLYAKIKARTGVSPKNYVTAFRMNRAMAFLKSGGYSVGEVADIVGSSSPYTFSREFKRHFGFPPSKAKSLK